MKADLLYHVILITQGLHPHGRGTFFYVRNFTNKGERIWNCRLGVKRDLHGGQLPYDPADKDLIVVWDRKRKDYRSIRVHTITDLKTCGEWIIKHGLPTETYLKHLPAARAMVKTRHKNIKQ